jgi:hypothetical protein
MVSYLLIFITTSMWEKMSYSTRRCAHKQAPTNAKRFALSNDIFGILYLPVLFALQLPSLLVLKANI